MDLRGRSLSAGWRILEAGLALALLAGLLAACSRTQPANERASRTVTVAQGVTVTWPAGGPASGLPSVKAKGEPDATAALTKPLLLGGRRLPSAVSVLSPAQHLLASGPLPRRGAILSFRIRRKNVLAGALPFLATLNIATGQWVPVPSSYDAATGVVSAHVTHFSVWAPFEWVKPVISAVLRGALESLFSVGGSGEPPGCSAGTITVTDSRPDSGVAACAQPAGTGHALAKVVNQRPYPVDFLYQPGDQVDVPATDLFTQLGEDLNNLASTWHDRVLLPGEAEADATLALPAGHRAELATELDTEAYLTGILGTGVQMLAKVLGGWQKQLAGHELGALGKATCLRDLVRTAQTATLSLSTAESLGSVAFECLAAAAKGFSDTAFSVATIAASLATELVAGIWGALDTILGNSDHLITLEAAASTSPSCPLPAQLLAAWNAASTSARLSLAAPTADITGFSDVLCWQGWVVAVPTGNGNGTFVFSQQNGLHLVSSAAEEQEFNNAVCSSPASPAVWKSAAAGPADCNP